MVYLGIICSWRNNLQSFGGLRLCWFTLLDGWLALGSSRRLLSRMITSLWIGFHTIAFRRGRMLRPRMFINSHISIRSKWSQLWRKCGGRTPTTPFWWSPRVSSLWTQTRQTLSPTKKYANSTTPSYSSTAHTTSGTSVRTAKASGNCKDCKTDPTSSWSELEASVSVQTLDSLDVRTQGSFNTWNTTQRLTCSRMPSTQSKQLPPWLTLGF